MPGKKDLTGGVRKKISESASQRALERAVNNKLDQSRPEEGIIPQQPGMSGSQSIREIGDDVFLAFKFKGEWHYARAYTDPRTLQDEFDGEITTIDITTGEVDTLTVTTALILTGTITGLSHADLDDIVGTYTHQQIDTHIDNNSNPHTVTHAQVYAEDGAQDDHHDPVTIADTNSIDLTLSNQQIQGDVKVHTAVATKLTSDANGVGVNQTITPTWTGLHTFSTGGILLPSGIKIQFAGANQYISGTITSITIDSDDDLYLLADVALHITAPYSEFSGTIRVDGSYITDYAINSKPETNGRHFATGQADYQENYSMLSIYEEGDSYDTSFGNW